MLLMTRPQVTSSTSPVSTARAPSPEPWRTEGEHRSARISTGLRKNRKPQTREASLRLRCSFSPGTSRAVFNISSVSRFLGLGKAGKMDACHLGSSLQRIKLE
ncbi:hypothetical protein EYF80_041468 [Liparis tanakae]|uniref:Uncharacterized protein n=1 Tax=Liparis tanakae TaxID=230148 RepID=A0A4Z2G5E5_9TELE|nr:hypothetical protein EYF80_041468 [Liparis tanakae]